MSFSRTTMQLRQELAMPLTPPLTDLPINTKKDGFYAGFNQFVAIGSKVLMGLLII